MTLSFYIINHIHMLVGSANQLPEKMLHSTQSFDHSLLCLISQALS